MELASTRTKIFEKLDCVWNFFHVEQHFISGVTTVCYVDTYFQLPVVFYHGSKDERATIVRKISKKHQIMENVNILPVVITSYEIAMKDRPVLQMFDWTYMIVDEGHRIKNKNCRLIRYTVKIITNC